MLECVGTIDGVQIVPGNVPDYCESFYHKVSPGRGAALDLSVRTSPFFWAKRREYLELNLSRIESLKEFRTRENRVFDDARWNGILKQRKLERRSLPEFPTELACFRALYHSCTHPREVSLKECVPQSLRKDGSRDPERVCSAVS